MVVVMVFCLSKLVSGQWSVVRLKGYLSVCLFKIVSKMFKALPITIHLFLSLCYFFYLCSFFSRSLILRLKPPVFACTLTAL